MERPIVGFRLDDLGDWVAILSCGHLQHVRHTPPFTNRPWVTTQAGREGKLGEMLNCVRCERFELPVDFVAYKHTPVFTEETVPQGLRKDHATKRGTWATIVVKSGRLRYHIPSLEFQIELSPGRNGIVIPEILHSVTPLGPVEFFVEFYRAPEANDDP